MPQEDISNLTLSQVPALLEEYKSLVVSMKKSFVCPTCNKTFSSRYSLNVHMNIHSESKPYVCTHTNCRKCFRTKSALNTHINLTHTEIKDNICTICGKAFAKAWLPFRACSGIKELWRLGAAGIEFPAALLRPASCERRCSVCQKFKRRDLPFLIRQAAI